ncbi:PREDICTED: FYVE, RhoGEF and PH domain-containing protein 1-like, partial [Priapulus caudatus]|uniref:FYVE, RhoGEF and PH domain-containing protein 1-like n=1 Tax=Priapulus caudatus TaxID=37621 RepID=A0ABM1EHK4_PRICU
YLKRLPQDSPDRTDAEKALSLVSNAANHINLAMRKIKLPDCGNLCVLHHMLQPFNDLVLLCSELLISTRGSRYKVRARMDMDGLEVADGDNLEMTNTFYIRTRVKSIELYTQNAQEKEEWMQGFYSVIQEDHNKRLSMGINEELLRIEDDELGRRAPIPIKDDSVSSCMSCKASFNPIRRRKKCKACGAVMCSKCVPHKLPLPYDNYRPNKVCHKCYQTIQTVNEEKEAVLRERREKPRDPPPQRKDLIHVSARDDDALVADFMNLRTRARGKQWTRRWFSLHNDLALYSFKSQDAKSALTSMPLHGYQVALPDKNDAVEKENVFKLFLKKKVYYFQAESKDRMNVWISILQKVCSAEQ